MKSFVLLATLSFGCSRGNDFIDFTKLDFAQPGDGGVPATVDFAVEANPPDLSTQPDLVSTDFAGGAGCGVFADQTLSWYLQRGVALTATGPLIVSVPDGVRLSGTVSVPAAPPGGSYLDGVISVRSTVLNDVTSTTLVQAGADGRSFTYSLSVPPGSYTVSSRITFDMGNDVHFNRYGRGTPTVCSSTVHDQALPAIPTLTSKTVTVTGFAALQPSPSPQPRYGSVYMEDNEGTLVVVGQVTATGDSASTNLPLPSQALLASVYVADGTTTVPAYPGWGSSFQLPSQPAAASYTLPLPESVKLSGTVTLGAGLITNPAPAVVQCSDSSPTRFVGEDLEAVVLAASPSYRSYYRKGHSCVVAAAYVVKMPATGNTEAYLYQEPNGTTATTFDSDKTINFTMPTVPAAITISGALRDARNQPLANRRIYAESTSLNGLSANLLLVAETTSDGSGNFKLNLLPGTYDLTVTAYLE